MSPEVGISGDVEKLKDTERSLCFHFENSPDWQDGNLDRTERTKNVRREVLCIYHIE